VTRSIISARFIPRLDISRLALPLGALAAGLLVGIGQLGHRAPLLWDEAARVDPGVRFLYAVRDSGIGGGWDWINSQIFYPFMAPLLHGIVYFFTGNEVVAAWVPGLLAYCGLGILVAILAKELGADRAGVWLAAALAWLTPLTARLAGGAFTEPLGACVYVALLIFLLRMRRAPRLHRAFLVGLMAAVASWLKWDYGLVATTLIAVSGVVAPAELRTAGRWFDLRRIVRSRVPYLLALAFAALIAGALLIFNWDGKLAGAQAYVSQAAPTAAKPLNFLFYPASLFSDADIGLTIPVACLFLIGVAWGSIRWLRRPAVRAPLLLVGMIYAAYSISTIRSSRYIDPVLPVLAALAGGAATDLWSAFRASPWAGRTPVKAVAGVLGVVLVAGLAGQAIAVSQPLPYHSVNSVRPDPAVEDLRSTVAATLSIPLSDSPIALLGPTNDFSPPALQLMWDEVAAEPAPPVVQIPEAESGARRSALIEWLRSNQPVEVVGVAVSPGSFVDDADYEAVWAVTSQADYFLIATALAREGLLHTVTSRTLEHGLLTVSVWQPNEQALATASG
jgi:hypothetical protein